MRTKSKFRHGSSGGADTDDLVALGMCSALAAEAADDLGAARPEATCRQMWVAARKVEAIELAFQIDLQIPWTTQGQVMNYAAGMLNEGLSPATALFYLSQMKAMHIAKGKLFPADHQRPRQQEGEGEPGAWRPSCSMGCSGLRSC